MVCPINHMVCLRIKITVVNCQSGTARGVNNIGIRGSVWCAIVTASIQYCIAGIIDDFLIAFKISRFNNRRGTWLNLDQAFGCRVEIDFVVPSVKNKRALLYLNKISREWLDRNAAFEIERHSASRGVNHKMPLCIFAGQQIIGGSLCDCELSVMGEVELITARLRRKCRDCPDRQKCQCHAECQQQADKSHFHINSPLIRLLRVDLVCADRGQKRFTNLYSTPPTEIKDFRQDWKDA